MDKIDRFVSPIKSELETLRQPLTAGERIVFDFFDRYLTSDWDIYIQPHMNGLRPDFVLMSKKKGIAVFEVKDWDFSKINYFYENTNPNKFRLMANDTNKTFSLSKNDPFRKLRQYQNEIIELYCPSLTIRDKGNFSIVYGGVIFPFANRNEVNELIEPLTNLNKMLVITSEDLQETNIKKVIPFVYQLDARMNDEIYMDFKPWLIEPEVSSEQRRPLIDSLDTKQKMLSETRPQGGRRRIRGPAGSGKSMVLCCRAARLASDNKDVLIVTYNITLLNYLLDLAVRYEMNGKVRNQITALHFHGLCKRLASDEGFEDEYMAIWNEGSDDKRGSDDKSLEYLAKKALSWASEIDEEDKYDAVFIDEGQDFHKEWLDVLGKLVKKDGELVLCVDQAQNVYGNSPVPEKTMSLKGFGTNWISLENSYRMPLSVCKRATNFLEEFLPNAENLRPIPKQDEIEFNTNLDWFQCNESEVTNQTVEALLNIINKSKSTKAFADLTCIVDKISNGKEIARALKDKNIKCIDTFKEGRKSSKAKKLSFYKGSATVKLTTIHSFKGWESTAVVLQFTRAQSNRDKALFYTAISRVRKSEDCYVTIVNTTQELKDFGKKWPTQTH